MGDVAKYQVTNGTCNDTWELIMGRGLTVVFTVPSGFLVQAIEHATLKVVNIPRLKHKSTSYVHCTTSLENKEDLFKLKFSILFNNY